MNVSDNFFTVVRYYSVRTSWYNNEWLVVLDWFLVNEKIETENFCILYFYF